MNDYSQEDDAMRDCRHEQQFILHERMCAECGKSLKSEVIEPGTLTETLIVDWKVAP